MKTGKTSIWLLSALISSLVPLFILLLVFLFPQLKEFSFLKETYNPFGSITNPLQGISFTIILSVSLIYWGVGVIFLPRSFSQRSDKMALTSEVLLDLGKGAFFFIIPLLSSLWALAITGGHLPLGPGLHHVGNHGPWHGPWTYHLRKILFGILALPVFSFLSCLISFIAKPSKLAVLLSLSAIVVLFVLFASHFSLID